jgi:ABC-type branched-subunit amino acid transport system permease subunit
VVVVFVVGGAGVVFIVVDLFVVFRIFSQYGAIVTLCFGLLVTLNIVNISEKARCCWEMGGCIGSSS